MAKLYVFYQKWNLLLLLFGIFLSVHPPALPDNTKQGVTSNQILGGQRGKKTLVWETPLSLTFILANFLLAEAELLQNLFVFFPKEGAFIGGALYENFIISM